MNLSPDCDEKRKEVKYGEGIDRISALPDLILLHILSFLPTKHVVRTSILSRRWQCLFTLMTNFDFEEPITFSSRSSKVSRALELLGLEHLKWSRSFKDFVDRVLLLSKATNINKFRLKSGFASDCSNLNTWIKFALHRGVTELDISTCEIEFSVLPVSLFFCKTLVVLKLEGRFEMKLPASFLLPCLKFLRLHTVEFPEECSLNDLISGCPVLEDLVLGGEWEDVDICSPNLRSLTIDFCDGISYYHRSNVELDLPNLLYFNYMDFLAVQYCLKNMNSLEEAHIDILLDRKDASWETSRDSVLELVNGVSSTKHLCLSGTCLEILSGRFKLPTFNNLSRLELGWDRYLDWEIALPELLHSSPILENLVFPEGIVLRECEYSNKHFWGRLQNTPSCLSSHLKTLHLGSFQGFGEDMRIIRYLLKHAKVLTKLIVYCNLRSKRKFRGLIKLCKIGRLASSECSVECRRYLFV